MKCRKNVPFSRKWVICAGLFALFVNLACAPLYAQQARLTEPVYRVADQSAAAAAQPVAEVALPGAGAAWPDLTARPGEHPLAPVIRFCQASLAHLDKNIADYSCTLVKRERLDGEVAVGEPQIIDMRVRHQPFSVHMSFRQPHAGRKVVYVAGLNDGQLTVKEGGLLGLIKVDLHPDSSTAMNGQKYPITKVGIRNLLSELIRNFEADTKYKESDVSTNVQAEFNKRPATLIQVTHPVPRQNFRSHVARIYFDNELRVPIYYDAYMWPAKEGDHPPMEESYAYTNLKLNNGYTDKDFDKSNPDLFK